MATVSYEQTGAVGHINIDDGAKNVINHEVLDELEACWKEASINADAIILSGRPGSFCAGYDIKVMTGGDPNAAKELGSRGGRFALELYGSDRPVIGVSQGHGFTIGAVWLACCDLRYGEAGPFKYGMTEVALGVGFSDWPLEPLRARLKPENFVPAVLHSEIYEPEAAAEVGFIDQVVPEGQALDIAMAKAAQLAELPRDAYAATKRVIRRDSLAIMAKELLGE